ncbi:TAXI family TRAP transporter solute-binding subunit [Actinomadura sp. 6N118]|uniref:TAXI family TRAP transporter solute-binding subunit n=1 Tax=Actinomadura sp. 6N118 TaxID=3375151 RepID=UPI0037986F55
MKSVQATAVLAVLILTGLAGLARGASSAPVSRLVIATGGEGGVYHALGTAFAGAARRRWAADTAVLTTAASVENLRLIADGRAHLGFATVDSAALAVRGEGPFVQALPIVALAGLYDDYLQIVVSADGPIQAIADLRDRRVSTGSAGSGTEIVAARVMEAAGLDLDREIDRHRLSASASAAALGRGEIDAFFFTGGLPTPAVAELSRRHQIRILPVGQMVGGLQARYGEVYQPRSIPANLYSLAGEVTTVGIANVLVVRADMSAAEAQALTALLFEAKTTLNAAHAEARRLDHRTALVTFPVPLHPGAAKYYQESKVMAAGSAS